MKVYELAEQNQNMMPDGSVEKFVILNEEEIETKPFCKCYGDYGQQIGCYDAGCYSPDNSNSGWKEGEEESHEEVTVYEYHDGHNFQTLVIGESVFGEGDLNEVDEDLEAEILDSYNNAEWSEWKSGTCTGKTQKYTFQKSQWQGSYGIADVFIN